MNYQKKMKELNRITVRSIRKMLGKFILQAKYNIDPNDMAQNPQRHSYYTGYINALLDLEEEILGAEYVVKSMAEYDKEITCDICNSEYTAEVLPGENTSKCPVCGNKNHL